MAERWRAGAIEGRRAARNAGRAGVYTKQYQNNNLGLKSFIKESGMIKRRTVKAEKIN